MRQVILDTETTGLSWERGCRVVEIGCVEFVERRPTGRTFHHYVNPDCGFEPGAQEVTGLTLDFLADKPRFAEVAEAFLSFIEGAELVIHNADFDVGFLDNELRLCGACHRGLAARCRIEDTLLMARRRYPGQRNSLDALCRRLGVDNAHRQLHGALLDAQLLAEVYIGLTSGQTDLGFGKAAALAADARVFEIDMARPRPRVQASASDLEAHATRLAAIRRKAGTTVWEREFPADAAATGEGIPAERLAVA